MTTLQQLAGLAVLALAMLTGCAATKELCGTTPDGDEYCAIVRVEEMK